MQQYQPFKMEHAIRTYETGSDGRLIPAHLIHVLQHTAGKHADELGWSVRTLHENNQSWVLQRFYVKITQLPNDGETLYITTYPSGADRIFAYRDYIVKDSKGAEVARATSSWVILDFSSRRAVAIPESVKEITKQFGERLLELPKTRLQSITNETPVDTFKVRRHDLDLNRHVNNVKYIEWMLESVPEETFYNQTPLEIDIVFKAECFPGDIVASRLEDKDGEFLHTLYLEGNEKEVCLGRTVWGKV